MEGMSEGAEYVSREHEPGNNTQQTSEVAEPAEDGSVGTTEASQVEPPPEPRKPQIVILLDPSELYD